MELFKRFIANFDTFLAKLGIILMLVTGSMLYLTQDYEKFNPHQFTAAPHKFLWKESVCDDRDNPDCFEYFVCYGFEAYNENSNMSCANLKAAPITKCNVTQEGLTCVDIDKSK